MRQRQPEHPNPKTQRRAAERLYALLLLLYPRAHRRVYGPLMLQTFGDSYRDVLATRGRAGSGFWLGLICDEAKSLVREHGAALKAEALRVKRWGLDVAAGGFLVGGAVIYVARCIHT